MAKLIYDEKLLLMAFQSSIWREGELFVVSY